MHHYSIFAFPTLDKGNGCKVYSMLHLHSGRFHNFKSRIGFEKSVRVPVGFYSTEMIMKLLEIDLRLKKDDKTHLKFQNSLRLKVVKCLHIH